MNKLSIFLSLVLVLLFSCNSDDSDGSGTSENNIELITNEAQNIQGTSVLLSGTVSSNNPNFNLRGVCWSTSNNPTINSGNYDFDNNNENGIFSFTINSLNANTQYYVRAFVEENNGNVIYGNQIVFTTSNPLNTNLVSNITTTKAILNGNITQGVNENSVVGFFYSNQPNVTQNDTEIIANYNLTGSDDFNIEVNNLNYNTVYYVRSFSYDGTNYTLGNEQQFKTVGYLGEAGGYVGYDKGFYSDGWRYLEIEPQTLVYNPNVGNGGSNWGISNFLISGTYQTFGTGLDNTNRINSLTNSDNCAAKLCYNYSKNGYTDWFLPSSEEAITLHTSLKPLGFVFEFAWTSSEKDANSAYTIERTYPLTNYYLSDRFKTSQADIYPNIYPVRRY